MIQAHAVASDGTLTLKCSRRARVLSARYNPSAARVEIYVRDPEPKNEECKLRAVLVETGSDCGEDLPFVGTFTLDRLGHYEGHLFARTMSPLVPDVRDGMTGEKL